jgi:iron-sulfur cluster assembly accessory protein
MMKYRFLGLGLCALAAAVPFACNDRGSKKPDTTPDQPPFITVTPKAAATIRQIIAEQLQPPPKVYLRVRVVPGGRQGFMHKVDLDTVVSAEDQVCETAGVSVVTFKRQAEMLRGTQVDFGEENGKRGFKVENPNFTGEWAKKWLAALEKEKDIK